uniref:Putative ribonuclease H-like domain-containing protein n=1 Tax=Tanacetum cinerariifolium TaxID=118510 RepID=A0A6L2J4N2_TANCI|nr:putative ribonuclease H-like domain-containing protein [Tanacetum cinerariifolium]
MYCLVVTDDFSRFSWVFFLATKDETNEILNKFITGIENLINLKVKVIRCDNETEFKNRVMNQFCEMKGIKREYSVARTPQQNRVAERKNRTLIEAARTMLADSKLPTTFWTEAVNTTCRKSALSFMRPFGCPVTILSTIDHLGKFDRKTDEGFFIGYSTNIKVFRVFNSRTRIAEENLHVKFSENTPNIAGSGSNWLFDIDALTKSMNYKPVVAENRSNGSAGTKAYDNIGKTRVETVVDKDYILLPLLTQDPPFSSSSKDSPGAGYKPLREEEKKDTKDPGNEDSEAPITEEPRVNQEKDSVNSTNRVNAVSSTVIATSNEVNVVGRKSSIKLPDDLNVPELVSKAMEEQEKPISGFSEKCTIVTGSGLTMAVCRSALNIGDSSLLLFMVPLTKTLSKLKFRSGLAKYSGGLVLEDWRLGQMVSDLSYDLKKKIGDVKLVWDLHTTNIDQLHAYLGQHEFHANKVRLMHEGNSDPLALVATHQMTHIQSSTPLLITYPSNDYQSSVHHNAYSPPTSIPQIEYAPTINQQQQPEFPSVDLGLTVPVFKQGDDPINAINHMMSFLSAVVTSRYPTTNNQLRNSSNPRQQATINDGRITLQPVQGRQISFALGTSRTYTPGASGSSFEKQNTVICYNCKGEGPMSKQCTKPKRKRDDSWFKDKVLLKDLFIGIHNTAKVALMVNLSHYGLDVLAEVYNPDKVDTNMINPAMQTYKKLYESIKSARIRLKEQCDDLINQFNLKSVENSDLNASLQKKVLVITALKDDLRKLKEKALADDEQAAILKEVVKQEKSKNPLNNSLDHACVDLLTGSRGNNLYTPSLGDMMASSPVCLLSKASKTKSWLWRRRLSHFNFGTINHLARHSLVRGLLKLKFEKDHLCSVCAMGKRKKKPQKPKFEDTNQEKLYLLHMDLCGPMRVVSVNGKKYILIIIDDYSRFTWVKCLRSKDEAHDFIIKFFKMIQVRIKSPVHPICSHIMELNSLIRLCVNIMSRTRANTPLSTAFVAPSRTDWDILFQPLFDELLTPLPSVDHPAPKVIVPIAEVVAPKPVASTGSPSLTTVDQDAPSPSNSQTTLETQSPIIPNDVKEDNHDLDVAHMSNDSFFVDTPIMEKSKLDEDKEEKAVDPSHYHGMIGTLLYLTASKPDLQFAICMCARYQAWLTEKHLHAVKRIFRYLRGSVNRGLWYSKDSSIALTAFSYKDHAGCQETRRSTSSIMQFLGDRLVLWMISQLIDYDLGFNKILMYCDNKSVIALCCNNVQHSRERIEFLINKLGMRSFTPETLKQLADEVKE